MKAIINIPATDTKPAGKYIDLSVLRKEYEKRQGSCTLKELIDIVINDKSGLDLDEEGVSELIEKHYKK